MSEHTASTLSALMDDEASELDLRRSLKTLAEDSSEQARWKRYQAARAVMQSQSTEFLKLDVSAAVSAALETEESHQAVAKSNPILKPFAGFAVAASVAAAVFLAGPQLQNGAVGQDPAQIVQSTPAPATTLPVLGASGAQLASQQSGPAVTQPSALQQQQLRLRQEKLNAMMSIYAQQAALNSPLARHANYSPE